LDRNNTSQDLAAADATAGTSAAGVPTTGAPPTGAPIMGTPTTIPVSAASRSKHGMRLSARLWLLMLVCLTPMLAALLLVQIDLRQDRQARLGELAMRQAALVSGDLTGIVEAGRQIAVAATQFARTSASGPACSERISALLRDLPAYKFVALYDRMGRAMCASDRAPNEAGSRPAWLADMQGAGQFRVGSLTKAPDIDGAFLPMGLPLQPPVGSANPDPFAVVVVALDLAWLDHHLAALRFDGSMRLANFGLAIADRDGNVLARFPVSGGDRLSLIQRETAGIATASPDGGRRRVAAYSPGAGALQGLAIVAEFDAPGLLAGIWREVVFAALATVLALVLGLLAARRFIIGPTERLLAATRRWNDGDLSARADVGESGSEFGVLAASFNAMAAQRAHELERLQAVDRLEALLSERSRQLAASNDLVQVEAAERQRAEAALHKAQKLRLVGQLVGGIAHDFNNVLATILGNLDLMMRQVAGGGTGDATRLQTQIERAIAAVQRGADLTGRLLAFGRRQPGEPRTTDLNRLVMELVVLASSLLGRRIEIVTELAPDLWPIRMDPGEVEAALLNLCLNARDAMPNGGKITIVTANDIAAAPMYCVLLSVIDTGIGMTPDVQGRAFENFFTTKGQAGVGLGLGQVHGLARQSGGTVRLLSAPNRGTEVTIVLPRAVDDAAVAPVAAGAIPAGQPIEPTMVLVVDDDAAVRQVIADMLRSLGCEVMVAGAAAEALAQISADPSGVDVMVVDYAMPGMNGLELAAAVRRMNIDVSIAMITGYADVADRSETDDEKVDFVLRKPFTIREMRAMLLRLRHRPRPSAEVIRLRPPRRG
jgi:signal transduction histidine kinase/ActR/RegA family two-component response regulator